jgi:chemotaxis signal transduction protein
MDSANRPAEKETPAREPCGVEEIFLVLLSGQMRCAIPAADIRGVLLERPTAVCPGAGKGVAGVMFYRGTSVTVFDLSWILTGREAGRERGSRIVVLQEPCWAALLVDGVLGLAPGSCEGIETSAGGAGAANPFVIGRIRWLNHGVGVVDIRRVLEAERSQEPAAAGAIAAALDMS